jgi:hypothetical protein
MFHVHASGISMPAGVTINYGPKMDFPKAFACICSGATIPDHGHSLYFHVADGQAWFLYTVLVARA